MTDSQTLLIERPEDLTRSVTSVSRPTDARAPAHASQGLLGVIRATGAAFVIAISTSTRGIDPWAKDLRGDSSTRIPIVVTMPRRITMKQARELALEIMAAAEASRARYAEEEAARGISWDQAL